jgi:hypothetical protein
MVPFSYIVIRLGDAEKVRQIVLSDKSITSQKYRDESTKFDSDVELDAFKFLGAYLGSVTCLQYAILMGQDAIAKDILERSFTEDLNIQCGGGNTVLHLGIFL